MSILPRRAVGDDHSLDQFMARLGGVGKVVCTPLYLGHFKVSAWGHAICNFCAYWRSQLSWAHSVRLAADSCHSTAWSRGGERGKGMGHSGGFAEGLLRKLRPDKGRLSMSQRWPEALTDQWVTSSLRHWWILVEVIHDKQMLIFTYSFLIMKNWMLYHY